MYYIPSTTPSTPYLLASLSLSLSLSLVFREIIIIFAVNQSQAAATTTAAPAELLKANSLYIYLFTTLRPILSLAPFFLHFFS